MLVFNDLLHNPTMLASTLIMPLLRMSSWFVSNSSPALCALLWLPLDYVPQHSECVTAPSVPVCVSVHLLVSYRTQVVFSCCEATTTEH